MDVDVVNVVRLDKPCGLPKVLEVVDAAAVRGEPVLHQALLCESDLVDVFHLICSRFGVMSQPSPMGMQGESARRLAAGFAVSGSAAGAWKRVAGRLFAGRVRQPQFPVHGHALFPVLDVASGAIDAQQGHQKSRPVGRHRSTSAFASSAVFLLAEPGADHRAGSIVTAHCLNRKVTFRK